jgi:hypothetical protein
LFNKNIFFKLWQTFETIYFALNAIGLFVFLVLMAKHDSTFSFGGLVCFCFFLFFSGIEIFLMDAYPAAGRKQAAYFGTSVSIIGYLIVLCSVFFHLAVILQDQTYQIESMTVAASGQCISCINNLLIFSCRNMYNAIYHPDAMVSCKF